MEKNGYVIHKNGRGWYCPNSKGYTLELESAGRYSLEEAEKITHPNGFDGPRDGMTYKHESEYVMKFSCEEALRIHDLAIERDMLLKSKEELSKALNDAHEKIRDLECRISGYEYAADFIAKNWV